MKKALGRVGVSISAVALLAGGLVGVAAPAAAETPETPELDRGQLDRLKRCDYYKTISSLKNCTDIPGFEYAGYIFEGSNPTADFYSTYGKPTDGSGDTPPIQEVDPVEYTCKEGYEVYDLYCETFIEDGIAVG